jgi:hypothetical protein
MAETSYLNFDLVIRQTGDEQYRAEATIPGWKVARVEFGSPFSAEEVDSIHEVLGGPARDLEAPEGQRLQLAADCRQKVMSFGRRLYETVFVDDMREGLNRRLTEARNLDSGLRIRLTLDEVPRLAALPWEYLYGGGPPPQYLVIGKRTPIVRFLPLGEAPPTAMVKPPLNILVMLANPPRFAQLKVQEEWTKINNTLKPLILTNQVTVDRLPNATHPKATQEALLEQLGVAGKEYHVLHFIGHGGFDALNRVGLGLEGGADDQGEIVATERLSVLVDHFSLRLVILNACDGAKSSRWDAYSGVAQRLVQAGIPAVIAMQFKITDDAAIKFAESFYQALAAGLTVEDSLNLARKKIWVIDNPTEWGTPVLFSQSEDGKLFQIDRPDAEQVREAQVKALSGDARVAIEHRNWALAIKKLKAIQKLEKTATGG